MKNIVLVGFMGTGKTAVGRRLAKRLDLPFVDLDENIARSAGRSIPEIFVEEGEPAFRKRESEAVQAIATGTGQVVAAGGGGMLNEANVQALKRTGFLICLTARPEVILKRALKSLPSRPLLNGPDPEARIEEMLKQRAASYAKADVTIDTSDRSVQEIVEEIVRWINEKR